MARKPLHGVRRRTNRNLIEKSKQRETTAWTTDDEGHKHQLTIYPDNSVVVHEAVHPNASQVKHSHEYFGKWPNGYIIERQSGCWPHCMTTWGVDGAGPHSHGIDKQNKPKEWDDFNVYVPTSNL